jgi:histone H3/H4
LEFSKYAGRKTVRRKDIRIAAEKVMDVRPSR